MIGYHVCSSQSLPRVLSDGLKRRGARHYVFEHWEDVQAVLAGLLPRDSSAIPDPQSILVIEIDPDMLLAGPIPSRRVPLLEPGRLAALQRRSRYLETDLNPERILDVKDGFGNSIRARFEEGPTSRSALHRFLAYLKPYWPLVAAATAAGIVKFLAPLAFPWMLKVMLDDVILNESLDAGLRDRRILELVAAIFVVNGLWMAASYYRRVFAATAGHRMIRDMRIALFDHVQRLSHSFFTRNQSGAIVSRVVNDMSVAQNFVGSALTNVWMDGILLVVLIAVLFSIHAKLTLISLILMPLYVLSLRAIGSRIRLTTREVQERLEILSGDLQEKVAGVGVVKGFNREMYETRAFASQANKLLNKILYSVRFMALNEMLSGLVVHGSPVLVVWYGAYQILEGELTVGELTQFLLYLGMFYFPLQRLAELSVVLANAVAAIERIFEYFDTQPQVTERPGATALESCRGRVEFDSVCFSYDRDVPVIRNVSLTIEPGQSLAIVGPSGSGKSTLANLVPRFYDPSGGVIRLDGHDLRDLTLASLRRFVGIVNQETILFSGTVQENLLLAKPDATLAEIYAALEAANAMEFVEELPEGLWTEIQERGSTLSGGQKQRLALARAFLKDPRILILDEATSALDSRSERRIQDALPRLLKNRTSIVIAHRLSTIRSADLIAVLEHGRIVETGRHDELVRRNGLYARLKAADLYV
jgi:subfamily B ATP-binding cassette protein MsbA